MMKTAGILFLAIVALLPFGTSPAEARVKAYKKAVDDDEVVKNKLFPKKGKIEFNGDVGFLLNQSYISSLALHLNFNYFTSEAWGFGLEGLLFFNSDKSERTCIESFYNDPKDEVDAQCRGDGSEQLSGTEDKATYGPAYVPIRELQFIGAATATWNPVYGKQLFFLSGTGYFDLYVTMGAGIAGSNFYKKETQLPNGISSRDDGTENYGAKLGESQYYGIDGRPEPEAQMSPLITLGVGQKYHFGKSFSFKFELRNYTLLGTEDGFEAFFALWGGVGIRL